MKFDKEFLKKIRLEDLNVFITLCEEKNYSMAAKKLGKTQGTISSEIARLEECFGKNIKLINRTSKTFEITKNGEKLLEFANSTILNFQNLLNSLEENLPDLIGNLKISSSSIPGEHILPLLINEFRSKYPQVTFNLSIKNSSTALEDIKHNYSDFASIGMDIPPGNPQKFESINIGYDNLVFVCSRKHELVSRENLMLEDLYKFPFIFREKGSATRDSFERSKYFKPDKIIIGMILESNQSILTAIRDSNYITVMSSLTLSTIFGADLTEKNSNYAILRPKDYKIIKRDFFLVRNIKESNKELNDVFWEFCKEKNRKI